MTKIIPIPALKDNYIWMLLDDSEKYAVVVDPGEAKPVIETLEKKGCELSGILITHHHWDHTNGIADLLDYTPEVLVAGSIESRVPGVNLRVNDGEEFAIANVQCKAIAVPGHTLDHTAYYDAAAKWIFTGDTLFSAGCGRIFEGTPEMMYQSLQKITALPEDTKVYCGHEYTSQNLNFAAVVEPDNHAISMKQASLPLCTLPSILGEEKRINPFLRCGVETVKYAAEQYAQRKLHRPVEVFAVLREWKNEL